MSGIDTFINFFTKETLDKIGKYLVLFAEVYIKPVKTWKRILNPRKTSLNYFIIYVLFYGGLNFLITWDLERTLWNLFINLIVIVIPFIFLLIPFKLFTFLWKKRIHYSRLYRLFFVFTLQLVPFIHFPNLLADWSEVEFPYLISSNFLVLNGLLYILVIPIILKLKTWQRMVWICCNYIFASLYIIGENKLYSFSNEVRTIINKADYYTPKDEFEFMMRAYQKTDFYIAKDLLYVILNRGKEKNKVHLRGVQYVTLHTSNFITKKFNEKIKEIPLSYIVTQKPSILSTNDAFEAYNRIYDYFKENSLLGKTSFKPFSLKEIDELDSLRISFNRQFYHDLDLMDSLRSKAKYKSNREYANYIFKFLNQYDSIANDTSYVADLIGTKPPKHRLKINDSCYFMTYKLSEETIKYKLQGIIDRNLKNSAKYDKSYIVSKIIYYPVFKLLGYKERIFDPTLEFEHISTVKNSDEQFKMEMIIQNNKRIEAF